MTSIDSMLTKIWIGDLLTKKIQNDAVIEPKVWMIRRISTEANRGWVVGYTYIE